MINQANNPKHAGGAVTPSCPRPVALFSACHNQAGIKVARRYSLRGDWKARSG
jgi:hypothetical protein